MAENPTQTLTAEGPQPALGQGLTATLQIRYFVPRIEAGELVVPAKIRDKGASEIASMQMSMGDLEFSLACLQEVERIGIPDVSSLHSKVFAFSAVVAYARAFDIGARDIKLRPEFFEGLSVAFNRTLHDYLRNVRDKHVAHSVNDFESCKPVGLMIGMPGQAMRPGGIGFAGTQSIGIRREQVLEAIAHITLLIDTLRAQISQGQERLFQTFKEKFEPDGRWQPAPIASIPDGANVARRRPR